MDTVSTTVLVTLVAFLAAFVRSAVGFGDALIAMPLLALILGMQTATPLVAFDASTIALFVLLGAWRRVDVGAAWRLVLSTIVGIPFGLLLLSSAPEELIRALLGVVLVGFGLYNLIAPNLPRLGSERWACLFGLVAGILGGAYNTNGPPVVIYAALRQWPPERFRATLQGYFLPAGLTIVVSHGLAGLWTARVVRLYLFALPAIALAVLLGGLVNKRVSGTQFNRLVYGCLVVMGVMMFL